MPVGIFSFNSYCRQKAKISKSRDHMFICMYVCILNIVCSCQATEKLRQIRNSLCFVSLRKAPLILK